MEACPDVLRIELVDDQALVRAAIAELIHASEGMEIVGTAGQVDEAVRCAEETHPGLVLMDILPDPAFFAGAKSIIDKLELSGAEVYLELKGLPAGEHALPISFDLPVGVRVLEQKPARVRVRIIKPGN